MWTLRRVGGLEATGNSALRGASRRFLSGGRRSLHMRPGKDAERLPIRRGAAARPNCLTAVYSLRGGKPAVPESLWAPRPEQAPPHQPYPASTRLRYLSIFWRLLDSPRCASLVADDFSFSVSSSLLRRHLWLGNQLRLLKNPHL